MHESYCKSGASRRPHEYGNRREQVTKSDQCPGREDDESREMSGDEESQDAHIQRPRACNVVVVVVVLCQCALCDTKWLALRALKSLIQFHALLSD